VIKKIFKFVIWPVKKIVLLPFKFLLYTLLIFVVLILFFQYRADYGVDTSPLSKTEYENCIEVIDSYEITLNLLSEYVEELDSVQREFLEERLPDNLKLLLEPKKLDPDEFENLKSSLKTYLQGGRLPGFTGKALLPQAASLCRSGLG
tara:strand:+ start:3140 stop:3583 length:444 start_codon:yes stop_codon:yes gene_type:complete